MKMKKGTLKLGYHTHIPAFQKDGKIYMPGHIGFFIDALAKRCSSLVCFQHLPLKNEFEQMDYVLQSTNVTLINLGKRSRIPLRTLSALVKSPKIKKSGNNLDAIIIRTPTPLLPIFEKILLEKIVLYIVGDYLSGIDYLNLPPFRKRIIKVWSKWIDRVQFKLAKNNLTFVNGHHLYLKLKDKIDNLVEVHTTTIREKDFFMREDTCTVPPYKLLYCGRIIKEKGIMDLMQATLNLIRMGKAVVLELVGPIEKNEFLEEIIQFSKTNGIEDKIKYFGYRAAGDDLLSCYRNADIFVCPTQILSETYPRTIREAMASCLPVVATKVGSLPYYIDECSILVEPKDISSLTSAILMLIEDKELRKNNIKKALEVVKDDTVEKRAEELIVEIEKWIEGKLPICGGKYGMEE